MKIALFIAGFLVACNAAGKTLDLISPLKSLFNAYIFTN